MNTPTGYVLYEDSNIVVIATLDSENRKTGNMIQIWILVAGVSPVEAVKTGLDRLFAAIASIEATDSATERVT